MACRPSLTVVQDWGPALALWALSYNRWAAEAMVILVGNNQVRRSRSTHPQSVAHVAFGAQNKLTPQYLVDRAISAAGYNPANYGIALGVMVAIGVFYRIVAFGFMQRRGAFANKA
jgi:hypothetical protein